MPKSSTVSTMPWPKISAHQRFTVTRATSGLRRSTSHLASASRSPLLGRIRMQHGRNARLDRVRPAACNRRGRRSSSVRDSGSSCMTSVVGSTDLPLSLAWMSARCFRSATIFVVLVHAVAVERAAVRRRAIFRRQTHNPRDVRRHGFGGWIARNRRNPQSSDCSAAAILLHDAKSQCRSCFESERLARSGTAAQCGTKNFGPMAQAVVGSSSIAPATSNRRCEKSAVALHQSNGRKILGCRAGRPRRRTCSARSSADWHRRARARRPAANRP